MTRIDSLMAKSNCSFCVVAVEGQFVRLVQRPGDVLLPVWVGCEVPLDSGREYARSESIRSDIRCIRNNKLTWQLTDEQDDFDFFFENIYVPTVTTSHGHSALPASYENRLRKFKTGNMKLLQVSRDDQILAGVSIDFEDGEPTLRDSGVLNGSSDIKKSGAISAAYLFAMDYLASKGHASVSFGLSRSFLDDGVLNYKRKFRPLITTGSDDGVLMRIRRLDAPTKSMLRASPCLTWRDHALHRTFFRDPSGDHSERQDRRNRAGWDFGIDAESLFDVSGDALRQLNT